MIVRWETVGPYMSITLAEEEEIKSDNYTYHQQKLACLRKWQATYSYKATYRLLIEIFYKAGQVDLSHKVAASLKNVPLHSLQKNEVDTYHQFLVEQYLQELPPGTAEFPFISVREFQYIKLSLKTRTRCGVKSLEMEDIFTYTEEERKVTLIQGAAGSGKSTLLWELKRRWARGELYPDIQLLISINLRDPEHHMAKGITDIIPHPDDELKQAVATILRGRLVQEFVSFGMAEMKYPSSTRENHTSITFWLEMCELHCHEPCFLSLLVQLEQP